ncbi:MAG: tetratricopeptide repeat protein [Candidatus Marinimicrobia bacterium]|nr:tetratricopeptide repeat protein [Candidatus Neomarinimicrobiota bacterium]
MTSTQLQSFLTEVLNRVVPACTDEFLTYFKFIQRERERLLNSVWQEIPADDLTPDMKQFVFKEIDFDSIVTHSKNYLLNADDYFKLLFDIAVIAIKFGQFEKAGLLLSRIIKNNQSSIDDRLKANSHKKLGEINFYKNNFAPAKESLEQSLIYFTNLNDTLEISRIKNFLGVIQVEKNLPVEGKLLFLEAQKLSREFDDLQLNIKILINLGIVSHRLGEFDEAMDYYNDALKLLNGGNNKNQRASVLHNIAIVYKSKEDYGKASAYLMKSISLAKETNNIYQKGISYMEQSEVTAQMGDMAKATALATTTFQIFSELGAKMHVAEVYKLYGMINRMSKKYDVALAYLENSKRINQEYNNHFNLGETYFEIGEYYKETGDKNQSLANYQEAIKQFQLIQANKKADYVEKAINTLPFTS